MSDAVIIQQHATANGGMVIEATLNSPKSLNALSADMIDVLMANLANWDADEAVQAIVINGAGDRAFCAGGDIRDLYNAMASGETDFGQNFFNKEYTLDLTLHDIKTPLIVWGNGYVMGGGMGVYQGADLRVVTPSSRLAMPEISIGLYPDVGASLFLQQVPDNLGLFLGLTAVMVNGTDACDLSMADVLLEEGSCTDLIAALCHWDGSQASDMLSFITDCAANFRAAEAPASDLAPHRDALCAAVQQPDLASVVAAIAKLEGQSKWLDKAIKTMSKGSPIGLHLTYRQQQQDLANWHETFMQEYYIAVNATRKGEFQEGIRALLIDKDGTPNWQFTSIDQVSTEFIDSFYDQQGIPLPDYA